MRFYLFVSIKTCIFAPTLKQIQWQQKDKLMIMIKQVMKSPFSGGNAVLRCEPSTLTFRKEDFCYIHQFYECEDTHERFSTTELEEANLAQV